MSVHTWQVHCLSEALSPITHMSGTVGNEGVLARETILTRQGPVTVPILSGNAVRHRAIREPGMLWLIDRWELRERLNLTMLNFLLHGGNLTESTAHENTRRIADMQRLFPLLRLLGGCLPNQVLAGSLHVWRGMLCCEENRPSLEQSLPVPLPERRLLPAEHFISSWQYTRGDARNRAAGEAAIAEAEESDRKSQLMLVSGQAVARGAVFSHGFLLERVSLLELGALALSLALWQQAGGTIGGQAGKGHGRLKTQVLWPEGVDPDGAISDYAAHCDAVREEAIDWLFSAFAPKPKKEEKEEKPAGVKKKTTKKKAAAK